jgi:hypothetical protein
MRVLSGPTRRNWGQEALAGIALAATAVVVGKTVEWVRAQGVSVDCSRVRAEVKGELELFGLLPDARLFDFNRAALEELAATPRPKHKQESKNAKEGRS